jgi:hypothetical protein
MKPFLVATFALTACAAQYQLTPHAPALPEQQCYDAQDRLDALKCGITILDACKDRVSMGASWPKCAIVATTCEQAMSCEDVLK